MILLVLFLFLSVQQCHRHHHTFTEDRFVDHLLECFDNCTSERTVCDHRVLSARRSWWLDIVERERQSNETWLLPTRQMIEPPSHACVQRVTSWRAECECLEFADRVWDWLWSYTPLWKSTSFCCECMGRCLQ